MNKPFNYILSEQIAYGDAEKLWLSSNGHDVFNHPGCWRALAESGVHPGQIVSVEVRSSGGELAAIWPFVVKRGGPKDFCSRIAEPLGAHYVDYVLPIVNRADTERILPVLMEGVGDIFLKHGRMRLPKIIEGEGYMEACDSLIGMSFAHHRTPRSSPRLRFGKDYAETESFWGKSHRPTVRRKLKFASGEGDLTLWVAESREEIAERLPVLFEFHRKKWKGQGKPSQFDNEEDKLVFEMLARNLPMPMLDYTEVRLDGRPMSCHFGFRNDGWLEWYKPAFDPDCSKYSPGLLHVALLVRYGHESGCTGIDFMQGDEEYKFRWSNDAGKTQDLVLATKMGVPWWLWEKYLRGRVRKAFLELRDKEKK